MKDMEHCPCCSNHCLKGSFKCNKGAMYFAKLQLNEKRKECQVVESVKNTDDLKHIVHLLKKVSHKIEKHKHDISLEQLFSTLNDMEIKQLESLLQKLREMF